MKPKKVPASQKRTILKVSNNAIEFKPAIRLPITPKRPDRKTVERRRATGRAVSVDKRFSNPQYLSAIRKLLIKVGRLVKRGDSYRIPLSDEKEVVDYSVTFSFRFNGIGHDDKPHRHTIPAVVRILSLELESAVSSDDYLSKLLVRAYIHTWFGPCYTLFRSGGIRTAHIDSIRVDRLSLSEIQTKESKLRKSARAAVRRTVKKDPTQVFGPLKLGKKYFPRGKTGGEYWVAEMRSVNKQKRLCVVQRFFRKDGKKSKRRSKVLWRPSTR